MFKLINFTKLLNDNEFELIFNIDAKNKIFNDIKLVLPDDFETSIMTK